ncbi:LexA family transcriptional regulator [Xanthomonas euvesicatoria]|uniref:Phage repressor protein C with HTH and peptisase S24 domain n=1 Tax=Xanthomonas euvesicatoria TaxID=456327 RepID=A0AAW3U0Y2_XANEU|nr:XRE family transcriptional regulator [Xanthomonas euvesicatoria]MBB4722721.1 phage repressor protein C with HTH and peptisase S24 domain [Xanthomonas euvesicatoria]MBB4869314.1 phage repressor protein C with HTH and peptisase S24 domain [Xanthomonas euvesicatoria]
MQYTNDLCGPPVAPDNSDMNRLSENLRHLMGVESLSENQLSRNTGVPQPTIHRVLSGRVSDPRDGTLRPLAEYFGLSVEELRTGKLDEKTTAARRSSNEPLAAYRVKSVDGEDGLDPDREVIVAEVDVLVSAGVGLRMPEFVETRYRMSYQLSWFRQVGAKPEDVRVMRVTGDSMERTLFDGDRIAVNIADNKHITDGRVYVFTTGGTDPDVKIKRLFKMADGRLRIVSDNADKALYPDEILTAEDVENVHIVGRVIDRSGRGGL